MNNQQRTEDEHFKKFEERVESVGKVVMCILGTLVGIGITFSGLLDKDPVSQAPTTGEYRERTVPARIYSTAHDICGIITANNIRVFAKMSTVPSCKDTKEDTADIDVTVVKDEAAINGWRVLRISRK